jgi:hypothetical protein
MITLSALWKCELLHKIFFFGHTKTFLRGAEWEAQWKS